MKLILVPTPINDDLPLETVALETLKGECLKEEVILLVEEHKVARQRWIKWGLPREAIEKFILYNEHTQEKLIPEMMRNLKGGKRIYLLSDCGLPAFCDPGEGLVDACHKQKIPVSSTPYPNSISLALALSGFPHSRFTFCGFIPLKSPERENWMKSELKNPQTLIWMDTPYRLKKVLEELVQNGTQREVFLAMDLGAPEESLLRGKAQVLVKSPLVQEKREFVMVISPTNFN